ncbi:hypothetical protein Tco_0836660, partial [Tanacetum coccineum]
VEVAVVTWQRGDDVEWIYGGGGVVVGWRWWWMWCASAGGGGRRRRRWPEKMKERENYKWEAGYKR